MRKITKIILSIAIINGIAFAFADILLYLGIYQQFSIQTQEVLKYLFYEMFAETLTAFVVALYLFLKERRNEHN